jgi:hypothetical protein
MHSRHFLRMAFIMLSILKLKRHEYLLWDTYST